MNNLEKLRQKKEKLKKEISDIESLMKFEDKKKSLSYLTNGFTDRFLEQSTSSTGEPQLSIKTAEVAKSIGQSVIHQAENKSIINFNNSGLTENLLENALKIGGIALAGNIAKNQLQKRGWKGKLLGTAMVYLLPVAAKFISEKVENYQKKKSISSLEKLI